MWSSTTIPGKPAILVVDGSRNREGWESEFCQRLFGTFRRKSFQLVGDAPAQTESPADLQRVDLREPNCILLFAYGATDREPPGPHLRDYLDWLKSQSEWGKVLLATCSWSNYDPDTTQEILNSATTFAPFALAQDSPLTAREAGLFFLKFFTELNLHSADDISGRMVWFSCSKAQELLRRRRLTGKVKVRC